MWQLIDLFLIENNTASKEGTSFFQTGSFWIFFFFVIPHIKQELFCIICCSDVILSHTWHISALFQRRKLDTCRRTVGTAKSERSSLVDVGLSKIYSFPPTRDCLPLWRGPTAVGERRRGVRKWKLFDIASIMVRRARQMARSGKRPRKAQSQERNRQTNAFSLDSGSARKNVIALVGEIRAAPQFLATIRHTLAVCSRVEPR